ncbi:MAG: ribonuclease PH [Armatimonadota bacterium]
MRKDGRTEEEIRPCTIECGCIRHAEGSAFIRVGDTHVLCVASVSDRVPKWLARSEQGWITAEYSMLPRSTAERTPRESTAGVSGRTQEIQRMIGRALRAVCDLHMLGTWSIVVDCDVIQADGGTRTAAITGAYVALAQAISWMIQHNLVRTWPLSAQVAAISAGLVQGDVLVDLTYEEDRSASVDLNLVLTHKGQVVEIQAAAEGNPFSVEQLNRLIGGASKGLKILFEIQRKALEGIVVRS